MKAKQEMSTVTKQNTAGAESGVFKVMTEKIETGGDG